MHTFSDRGMFLTSFPRLKKRGLIEANDSCVNELPAANSIDPFPRLKKRGLIEALVRQ